jgi:recombinational DNA repair protein RecR
MKKPRTNHLARAALAAALLDVKRNTRFCSVCFHITEQDPCTLCADPMRDPGLLCVVEEPQAVLAVERSRSFAAATTCCTGRCRRSMVSAPTS